MGNPAVWETEEGSVEDLARLTSQTLDPGAVPLADRIAHNIPLYEIGPLGDALSDPEKRQAVMAEWAWVLGQGPGVLVLKAAYADTAPIDRATAIFDQIIAAETAGAQGKGDHFAASGANDRIWNSLQKHGLADPEGFALYYGNTAIATLCEAWLGPFYQMTAQVNLVRPGGAAQRPHRDYHLGFQSAQTAARFPAHVHQLSSVLTLQGAIAHCDMPVESGPTMLLPYSQLVASGYLAYRRADVAAYFTEHAVQLPLSKGDALFFNPALYHGAGANRSAGIARMANLLQVSSAFGRAMEAVDRHALCLAITPALRRLGASGQLDAARTRAAIAAFAEGYAFPTNLDTDPPTDGLAPPTQADLVAQALSEDWTQDRLQTELAARAERRLP